MGASMQVVSDKYKERRKKQIPHTTSRKGMVRLAEEMKIESGDPSEVTRLKVWVKSRTKKDGTPVNTNAAEKIRKAAELVGSDAPTDTTNPEEDHLSQLLGPDNPGRLRAMGRGMSKTKLACFQVKTKCMTDMQEKQIQLVKKVHELEDEISRMKNQRHEAEIGENSAARSVNKRAHPKCVLVDWSGSDDNIGEGRILSSDPDDIVNDCRLGPTDLKVLVETATKPDAFLWRPATKMFTIEEAVGQIIAWPTSKCVLVDKELNIEDIAPTGLRTNSLNKCKLLDLSTDEVIVAEGRWQTQEPTALVNGLPLGPKAVKVFVDSVQIPETFIWRPTIEMTYLEDCLMDFVSWPVNKVVFENPTTTTGQKSPLQKSASTDRPSSSKSSDETKSAATEVKAASTVSKSPATGSESPIEDAGVQSSPIKKNLPNPQSPLRKSQRLNPIVSKENKKCKLMDITGKKRVVAEGRWATNDPAQKVHFVPLGLDAVKVWVDIVKVSDALVWRPSEEIAIMEDALGTVIAWPEDKVIMS
ncbi:putative transposase Ptta/En/Spm plant [Arabidopsis thaliana x Arabidopsis arenosa]|uniref:Putative transposase Ptta/En/Spm plant n=1 Tax=Arabidopsis thaliana x Arabidopsis arenosa TaxID=1240361 RepID=A0A8T1ZHU0_9BRAS|nr:putative transposase Ptta/En/Spm plant [Arabidopsis thaliana x Arabidopsis arenosa]